jgi:hypothetical protein
MYHLHTIDTCLMSISRISLRDKVTLWLLKLYFYIADVAKWSRALDIRLSDWCCSVSMCSNPVEGRTQICQFIYIYIAHIVYAPCGPLVGELINLWLIYIYIYILLKLNILANRRGRDCMVVGLTTTSAISGYHHWCWVRISIRERRRTFCDKVCQWFATGRCFSLCPPISSTNNNWPPRYS